MPRISKSLPLAALLTVGANAQLSTSSVVLNPSDTAVTTVTFSTCPSFTASVTTITNPHTSTYTGSAIPASGHVTIYATVCPGFCTGGPSCTDGLGPTTHTITATCPCHEAGPGGVGPGMTQTVAVCPTCGPGGSPITATLMTPIPGATGGAAPGAGAGGPGAPDSPGSGAAPGGSAPAPGAPAPGAPGSGAPAPGSGSGAAPGGSAPAAGAPGSPPSSPGTGSGSSDTGSSGPGAGAAPGGSAAGAGAPGASTMLGMDSGSPGSSVAPGAGSAFPSGAGSSSKYSNSSDISPPIASAGTDSMKTADHLSGYTGAASRLPIVGGILSSFAGLCGVLALLL